MSEREDALRPRRVHLASRPEITVARAGLSLTIYVEEGRYWAAGGATEWLRRFLDFVDARSLRRFTTSTLDRWVDAGATDRDLLLEELRASALRGGLRPFFEFRWVDDPGAARAGFLYREIDTERSPRTGCVQFLFPPEQNPDDVLALAMELAQEAPFASGVGGWSARFNPATAPTAFREIRVWTRRYAGLDVQSPDRWAYVARQGLTTVSWLSLLGPTLAARLAELTPSPPPAELAVMRFARGVLIRAGDRPTLGDSHRMEHPSALHAAARYVDPVLVRDLPLLSAVHWDAEATQGWQRRFAEPQHWM